MDSEERELALADEEKGAEKGGVDIRHDVYAWGRGYHGQLGLKDLKLVQLTPKRVKIRRFPQLQESDQATRIASVQCGERHTLLLCVNGAVWWAGEKAAVGKVDPNEVRKNKYDPKDEELSYQYTFVPYFAPSEPHEHARVKFKSVATHFTAKMNFAISEDNEVFVFGDNYPFQADAQERRGYVFAAAGKNFQTLLSEERIPYSWGDNKNGRLGLEYTLPEDDYIREDDEKDPDSEPMPRGDIARRYDTAEVVRFFKATLRTHNPKLSAAQKFTLLRKYTNAKADATGAGATLQGDEELGELLFPVQEKLKLQDQQALEVQLIQQDIDLLISFRATVESLHTQCQKADA